LATHGLDGVLITEVETSLGRIEGMGFPGIVLAQGGIDAALSCHRVAADWMDLGDDRDVKVWRGCEGGSHPGKAGAHDDDVVYLHRQQSPGLQSGPDTKR